MGDIGKGSYVCVWHGEGEGCRQPSLLGKSYCETHHARVYITLYPEMANYIIDKELDKLEQDRL